MFKLIGITLIAGELLLAALLANAPARPVTFRSVSPLGDKMPPIRMLVLAGDMHRRVFWKAYAGLDARVNGSKPGVVAVPPSLSTP